SVAAFAADEFERLGKPGILVLEIDIGAATERNRQCCDNAKLVSPKPHHGPPAAPTASRMRRFVLPAWQRAYVSGTPRFRRYPSRIVPGGPDVAKIPRKPSRYDGNHKKGWAIHS